MEEILGAVAMGLRGGIYVVEHTGIDLLLHFLVGEEHQFVRVRRAGPLANWSAEGPRISRDLAVRVSSESPMVECLRLLDKGGLDEFVARLRVSSTASPMAVRVAQRAWGVWTGVEPSPADWPDFEGRFFSYRPRFPIPQITE